MPLQFTTRPVRSFAYIVSLNGSLDGTTAPQLETELQRLLKLEPAVLALDLAQLSYISSAGIRVIQKTRRELEASRAEFKLMNPRPQVATVFDFVQLSPLGDMFTSLEALDAHLDVLQQRPRASER